MADKSTKARAVQSHKKKNRAEKRSRPLNCDMDNSKLESNSSPAKSLNISLAKPSFPLDGPISRLPNELLQSILVRLDMQELIPMQMVCKIWQAVIYSIGHAKKSLYVVDLGFSNGDYDNPECVKERSFGLIDSSTFTYIQIKRYLLLNEHFPSKLVELCPTVEQLVVRLNYLPDICSMLELFPSNQVTTLSIMFQMFESVIYPARVSTLLDRINLCTSLKVLDICTSFELLPTLAPTLARLWHFSCRSPYGGRVIGESSKEVVISLVSHFGPSCSSVNLQGYGFTDSSQWPTINGQWLTKVTHLALEYILDDPDQAIRTLCEHAVSLKVLRLSFPDNDYFAFYSFTSQMIDNLGKLQHLTELHLRSFFIDLTHLEESVLRYQFNPLLSIRIFTLEMSGFIGGNNTEHSDIDRFTSVLSIIIPNVQHLSVVSFGRLRGAEQYLTRFTQLQTHSFLP